MITSEAREILVVRQLAASDLGWFAEPQDTKTVKSKQRAININTAIVNQFLSPEMRKKGQVLFKATCAHPDCKNEENRILSKVQKNWRLGGKKVRGKMFAGIKEGDFFVAKLCLAGHEPFPMLWNVIMKKRDRKRHAFLSERICSLLHDRMTLPVAGTEVASLVEDILFLPMKRAGWEEDEKRKVKERIRHPNILTEMIRVSLTLSSKAQKDFLKVLETIAGELRTQLVDAGMICSVAIDHAELWKSMAGQTIAFIDGGTAALSALGAEPIAIRVGSYVVIPGRAGDDRERFTIEKQLVDELFEPSKPGGMFEDLFDDSGKLRDVARISLEAAGAINVLQQKPRPCYVFIHGALVNPVSSYALEGFPNFRKHTIRMLLPKSEWKRERRGTNFISVYLKQLEILRDSGVNICGVVERASFSSIVTSTILELLHDQEYMDASTVKAMKDKIDEYRITDVVMFHSILGLGEYLRPVEIDRNVIRRAPNEWKDIIIDYPKPMITYVNAGEMAFPFRVELFKNLSGIYEESIQLIVHSSRLMPKYVFPAGLDIVDKYAKVPAWMSRPINTTLAVQFLKKAMDSGNSLLIDEAKRILCGTTRDWLFRPSCKQ